VVTINEDDLVVDEDGTYVWQDQPFTGTARQYTRDGALISENSYVNGIQEGPARYWYPSGEPLGEEHFANNSRHGPSREWYRDGKPKRDAVYEHAVLVRDKQWDEKGNLGRDFQLTEEDPLYGILQSLRQVYGKARSG